jgi:hypothetical protein
MAWLGVDRAQVVCGVGSVLRQWDHMVDLVCTWLTAHVADA